MEMTEDLIRNVIQQVLTQMGSGGQATNGSAAKPSGKDGVYPTADAAVNDDRRGPQRRHRRGTRRHGVPTARVRGAGSQPPDRVLHVIDPQAVLKRGGHDIGAGRQISFPSRPDGPPSPSRPAVHTRRR